MSITLEVLAQAAASDRGVGIIDGLTGFMTDVQNLAKVAVWTLGILFFIWQSWLAKGAMARVVMAGVAAAVFVYFGLNMASNVDRVDNEINGNAATTVVPPSQLSA